MDVTALVLTAGRSKRMGQPKAWLEIEGVPLLRRVLKSAFGGACTRAVVVVGAEEPTAELVSRSEVLAKIVEWQLDSVDAVVGRPDETPIDSIRAGLNHIAPDSHVLLWPVDHPFASATQVASLITALQDRATRIAQFCVGDQHGHPVLLGADVARELMTPAADAGARGVVRDKLARIVEVEEADQRLLVNLNRPEDLARLARP